MDDNTPKRTIHLRIDKTMHAVTIQAEKEEMFRKAAANINARLARYHDKYPTLDVDYCKSITLLDFAVESLQNQADHSAEPYKAALDQLTTEIEDALGIEPSEDPSTTNNQ